MSDRCNKIELIKARAGYCRDCQYHHHYHHHYHHQHHHHHQMSHRCDKIELVEARAGYSRELKIERNSSRGEVCSWQKDSGRLEEEM